MLNYLTYAILREQFNLWRLGEMGLNFDALIAKDGFRMALEAGIRQRHRREALQSRASPIEHQLSKGE